MSGFPWPNEPDGTGRYVHFQFTDQSIAGRVAARLREEGMLAVVEAPIIHRGQHWYPVVVDEP